MRHANMLFILKEIKKKSGFRSANQIETPIPSRRHDDILACRLELSMERISPTLTLLVGFSRTIFLVSLVVLCVTENDFFAIGWSQRLPGMRRSLPDLVPRLELPNTCVRPCAHASEAWVRAGPDSPKAHKESGAPLPNLA